MSETSPRPAPAPHRARAMPRQAVAAIAWSGHFCGVMMCFLVYFAVRHHFWTGWAWLNGAVALFLFAGSAWMQWKLASPDKA
ncbi:MAG: hypothetical protein VKN33_04525 [Candidatus Sericytochromatia bacterium]|nr:hypothetical protein [Candidatus Sericytochromatia bacterium]